MSAIAEEIVLEGVDPDKVPPCQMQWADRECKEPSVARGRLKFRCCGYAFTRFVCARCLSYIRDGFVGCRDCSSHVQGNFSWRFL